MHGAVAPVVWASGGKDSLALLHLMRAEASEMTLLHVQVEDGFEGVAENLLRQIHAWGYERVHVLDAGMSLDAYTKRFGHPYDSDEQIQDIRLSNWRECKMRRIIMPLLVGLKMLKSNRVFTGSKALDSEEIRQQGAYMVPDEATGIGFSRCNPLFSWSDEQVYDYIDTHAISLPAHYGKARPIGKEEGWSECLSCTLQPAHWRLLRDYYPDEFRSRWPQVKRVFEATGQLAEIFTDEQR
jgi:3'-phosphoadenosine 5'-phosphosulfate sulfotransferase (PAPS reductase)/FAD synthetase